MVTNNLLRAFLLFLVYSLFINGDCRKITGGCAVTVYNFEIGVKAYPDADSVQVNDTIWFEINTPDTVRDLRTNQLIDYSGVENLGAGIGFEKLEGNSFTGKAVNKFHYLLKKGELLNNNADPDLLKEYRFANNNGYYLFKLGVVAQDTGIFAVVFSNAANVYRKSDKCTKASFTINFNETDQHYYLNPNFPGGPPPVGGDYYFKVIP